MPVARLLADLRYGFRQGRVNPGFACLAIVTLALGIGANTALFSVVRSVILKPLPYPDPDRLVRVWMDNRRLHMREDWASYLNYQDYKRLGTSFASIAAFTEPTVNLIGDGEPERVRGVFAEAAIFDVLGVTPIEGRLFTKEEEASGRENVVLISQGLAERRFGFVRGAEGVPGVLDRTLDFDGRRLTVIGVMPMGFAFPAKDSEFWAPLMVGGRAGSRVGYWLQMVARLKPGVTPVQAQTEMDIVGKQLEQQYPAENAGYGIYVNPLQNHVAGNVKTPLFVLLGAVGFVLLIACVNVAGLFLARAEARGREIVVRSAIGASRRSLIWQLLMEAGALAASAGAAGILAAYAGIRAILWLAPPNLPRIDEITLDGTVLAFAVGLTTVTALGFGLWPAWRLSRVNLQEALRESGRGMSGSHAAARTRSVLLVVQCALAVMLLAGAGLLLRSLSALGGMDTGFRTANLLTSPARATLAIPTGRRSGIVRSRGWRRCRASRRPRWPTAGRRGTAETGTTSISKTARRRPARINRSVPGWPCRHSFSRPSACRSSAVGCSTSSPCETTSSSWTARGRTASSPARKSWAAGSAAAGAPRARGPRSSASLAT